MITDRFILRPLAALLILFATFPLRAAQPVQALPPETLLPLVLNSTINSDKSKPGEKLSAKLKQDLPVDSGGLKAGTEVFGHIVSIKRGGAGAPATVVLAFDRIKIGGQEYALTTNLRALASMSAVYQARLPINSVSPDGNSVWDYNTRQVGGDIVYGRKDVRSEAGIVALTPEPGWVIGLPRANPDAGCGPPESNKRMQAFWVFSTTACGAYGDEELKIARHADDPKTGQITLTDPKKVLVRNGSGLLLMVMPQPATQSVPQ